MKIVLLCVLVLLIMLTFHLYHKKDDELNGLDAEHESVVVTA